MMGGHAERAHSLLSPSSAHRWMSCTPSAVLEAKFPDTTSEAAKEGTLAHELAEQKLRNYFYPQDVTKRKLSAFITKCRKDELWDDEMLGYTDTYLEYIKQVAMGFDSAPYVVPEKSYDLTEYIPGPGAHGTADCVMLHGDQLHIFDFKYGKGVKVEAAGNIQLQLYALGAYEAYKLLYAVKDVHLHIIQPRIDNISSWSLTLEDLKKVGEVIRKKAELAAAGLGEYNPSADACRFCRAKAVCRARAERNVALAFLADKKPDTLAPEEIGEYLTKGADVAKWLEDLKAYALSECLAGHEIPGYKAVEGRGSRDWTDMDAAFKVLNDEGYPDTVLYEKKALTLAQVEKLIGKKSFTDLVGGYVVKNPGKPALVIEGDKREAITNKVSAVDVFKNENQFDRNE